MARTKKAARRAPKVAEEAEAQEVAGAQEVAEVQEVAEAPPKKSSKNKKEAPGKDEEQPSPKKRRSSKKEEALADQKGEDEPSAEVAKVKKDAERAGCPLLVFAHGAAAPSSHEWMVRWKKLLGEATGAVEVVTFDYPYCANGKKGAPPKAEKLVRSHEEETKKAMSRHPGRPLVLVGKSMGSRVSCMVAGKRNVKVAAVVCLGYPLKIAHQNELRDKPLLKLKAPVLFVQGRRDPMCPPTELDNVRKKMTVKSEVHMVEDGDHSLQISKKMKISQDESDRKALNQISTFIAKALTNTL